MKHSVLIFCLALSWMFIPQKVWGQYTGQQLLDHCLPVLEGDKQSISAGICLGFVNGVLQSPGQTLLYLYQTSENDGLKSALSQVDLASRQLFCRPSKVTHLQTIESIVQYLKKHRFKLHEDGAYLILKALKTSYPCQAQ